MAHSLVTLAVFFVLGISLSEHLPLAIGPLLALIATLVSVALMARRSGHRGLADATVLALVLAFGCLRAELASPLSDPVHYLAQNAFGSGRFEVEVTSDPTPSGDLMRAKVAMRALWTGDRKSAASGTARLVYKPAPDGEALAYGDVLEIDGTLASPRDAYAGPGLHLKDLWVAEGVRGVIWPRERCKILSRGAGNPLVAAVYDFRHRVSTVLDQTHPPEVASFIRAILLGLHDVPVTASETQLPATLADYKATGTLHLLAISGCHVGILALVLTTVLSVVFSRRMTGLLTILALCAYAVLAGLTGSVMRATVMATVFIIGRMAYRPLSVFTALAAAALVLLGLDPQALFLPGFQMSFLAVLAIAYLTPPLMTRLDFLPPYLNALISTSLAATLGTTPVLALTTGQISLVAPIANVLLIPLFGIILPVALAAVAGSVFSPWIPFFFGAANFGFVTLFASAVHALAQLPFAHLEVPVWFTANGWVAYGLGLTIFGDWHNLREFVAGRLASANPENERPAPDEIDPVQLQRTMKELANLLPEENEYADPISQRLAAVRGSIRGQSQDLAPEFMLRYNALKQERWAASLDELTLAYLAFGDAYFLAARSPDKGPALLLLIKALEHELDSHLFNHIRLAAGQKNISTMQVRYPSNALVSFLASPPSPLSLEHQHEILWSLFSTPERPLKALVRSISTHLRGVLRDPNFFLDMSQFPLRLDQIYKRYYLRLDKEPWDWEAVRRARDEILGPSKENFFEQIGRAIAAPDSNYGSRSSVPREASRAAGAAADPGAGAPGVQDVHRLEDRDEQDVGDDQAHHDSEHDGQSTVEIHAGSSLKAVR